MLGKQPALAYIYLNTQSIRKLVWCVHMVDYFSAFKKPFQSVEKLLAGIFLGIIPFVSLAVSGYALKVAQNTLKKKNELPEWNNFGDLFIMGINVAIIGLVYFIPFTLLLFALIGPAALNLIVSGKGSVVSSFAAAISFPNSVIMIGLAVVLVFFMPIALIRYAAKGDLNAAFDIGEITRIALTQKYATTWVIFFVFGSIIEIIFGYVPFIGSSISNFIIQIVLMTLFAEVYSEIEKVKRR